MVRDDVVSVVSWVVVALGSSSVVVTVGLALEGGVSLPSSFAACVEEGEDVVPFPGSGLSVGAGRVSPVELVGPVVVGPVVAGPVVVGAVVVVVGPVVAGAVVVVGLVVVGAVVVGAVVVGAVVVVVGAVVVVVVEEVVVVEVVEEEVVDGTVVVVEVVVVSDPCTTKRAEALSAEDLTIT